MSTALIIVDVQKDFCEGGSLQVLGGNKVADDLLWSIRNKEFWYDHVVTTQDWHIDPLGHWSEKPDFVDSWPVHCKAGTAGADLHPAIAKIDATHVYKGSHRAAYSGFEGYTHEDKKRSLKRVLKDWGVTHVYIAGIAFDYCVAATARDAARSGFHTTVLMDYVASVYPDNESEVSAGLDALGIKFYGGNLR